VHSLAIAAPLLSIEPAGQVVELGQAFSLNVFVAGVSDLFAFQFDIGYDPATLNARAVTEGPFLAGGGVTAFLPGTIDNAAGTVRFTADTLLGAVPGVAGDGVLAKIEFTAVDARTSTVGITDAELLDSSLFDITFTTRSATVEAVPEPRAISLVIIALSALVGAGRIHGRRS